MNVDSSNSFLTPNNELIAVFNDTSLKLVINKARTLKSIVISSIFIIGFFVIGLFILYYVHDSFNLFGFNFNNSKIIFGLFLLFMSFLVVIGLFKLSLFENKRFNKSISEDFISNFFQIMLSFSLLLSLLMNFFRNFYIFSALCFICSISIFCMMYSFRNSSIIVNITKSNDSFLVEAIERISFSPVPLHWFTQEIIFFSHVEKEFYMAILPFSKSKKSFFTQLRNNKFNEYALLFDEAEKYSKIDNQFSCFLVTYKGDFSKHLGLRLAKNIPLELLEEILQFISKFNPINVIKLSNDPYIDFIDSIKQNS